MSGYQTQIEQSPETMGPPGAPYGSGGDPPQSATTGGAIPMISRVTITNNTGTAGVKINGVVVEVDCAASADLTRDALIAALQANQHIKLDVTSIGPGQLQLKSKPGVDFDIDLSAPDGGETLLIELLQVPGIGVSSGCIAARGPDNTVRPFVAAEDSVAGIVVFEHRGADLMDDGGSGITYGASEQVPIGRRGQWYAIAESAVTAGGKVYCRHTSTKVGQRPGALRADADSGSAIELSGAVWRFDAEAGAMSVVELNLP